MFFDVGGLVVVEAAGLFVTFPFLVFGVVAFRSGTFIISRIAFVISATDLAAGAGCLDPPEAESSD